MFPCMLVALSGIAFHLENMLLYLICFFCVSLSTPVKCEFVFLHKFKTTLNVCVYQVTCRDLTTLALYSTLLKNLLYSFATYADNLRI